MELMRGLKAGIAAGLIYGVLSILFFVISIFLFPDDFSAMLYAVNSQIPAEANFKVSSEMFILVGAFGSIIGGVIFGVILGLIFGGVYDKIPGKDSIAKGVFLGILFWVFSEGFSFVSGSPNQGLMFAYGIVLNLVSALLFGYLLGFLWDKFKP